MALSSQPYSFAFVPAVSYPGKISSRPASSVELGRIIQMMTTFTYGGPRSLLSSPSAEMRTQLSQAWQVLSSLSFSMTDPPEGMPHVSSFANPLTFLFRPLGHSSSAMPQDYALRRNCFASTTDCHLERSILSGDEVSTTRFRDHIIAILSWTYFTRSHHFSSI